MNMQDIHINDDDWYVIDVNTMTIIEHLGSKWAKPTPKPGQLVVRGMRAKYMALANRD